MSPDEFDPEIERLFTQGPHLNDSALFNAKLMGRLTSSSRMRNMVLGVASLFGGLIFLNEIIGISLNFGPDGAVLESGQGAENRGGSAVDQGLQSVHSLFETIGFSGVDYGSMGQMQVFWVAAALLLAVLSLAAVKLFQQV